MLWFRKLIGVAGPAAFTAAEARPCVRHDDKFITYCEADGTESKIDWSSISRVFVETTDAGPFTADLFWNIEAADGKSIVVAMGTPGEGELLKAMQRQLEAFDNMAVVEAMGSTERARFTVWEAAPS